MLKWKLPFSHVHTNIIINFLNQQVFYKKKFKDIHAVCSAVHQIDNAKNRRHSEFTQAKLVYMYKISFLINYARCSITGKRRIGS